MPYINRELRERWSEIIITLERRLSESGPGELNYVLTETLLSYLKTKKPNYETLNAIVGALECCKLEFYIRRIRPYEDEKCKTHGDVYDIHGR